MKATRATIQSYCLFSLFTGISQTQATHALSLSHTMTRTCTRSHTKTITLARTKRTITNTSLRRSMAMDLLSLKLALTHHSTCKTRLALPLSLRSLPATISSYSLSRSCTNVEVATFQASRGTKRSLQSRSAAPHR